MAGGGFLKHMIDSIKYNRSLRQEKKSLRESLGKRSQGMGESGNPGDLEKLLTYRAAQRKREAIRYRWAAAGILLFSIGAILFFSGEYYGARIGHKNEAPLRVIENQLSDSVILRNFYFPHGGKAFEGRFLQGLQDGQAISYYSTGERFRMANYVKGQLISELYFSRSGNYYIHPLKTRSKSTMDGIKYVRRWFSDSTKNTIIEVNYWQQCILPNSMVERPFAQSGYVHD